jgi:histone H3/H4
VNKVPKEHFLPILPFERIAKRAGVARLSREGAEELREIVEEIANSIAEHATRVAMHAGRKTVTREDVEFVTGKIIPQTQAQPKPTQPKKIAQQQSGK